MKLRDGILDSPLTGICKIDVEKIARAFGHSSISRWHDEYRLHNRRAGIKITISAEDARALIDRLGLVEFRSPVFKNGSVFHAKADCERARREQVEVERLREKFLAKVR